MTGLSHGHDQTTGPLSPVMRFLLDLVTARLTDGSPPRASGLDWTEVAPLVRHHRLLPYLAGIQGFSPAIQTQLKDLRTRAAQETLLLGSRLRMIAERFQEASIDLLVLKGMPQSILLFGNLHARSCRDIDLLIRPAQKDRAIGLLRDIGYGTGPDTIHAHVNALLLAHRDGGPPVELHMRLSNPDIAFAAADFDPFSHAVTVMVAGQGVPTLSPAATIAYAAWHAGRHRWSRLYWLADLAAAAIHRPVIDWREAMDIARQVGCERHLWLALWLAKRLMGIAPPLPLPTQGGVLSALRRAEAVTLALWAQPPSTDQEAARHLGALQLAHADIGLYEGWRALRLLYSLRHAALNRLIRSLRPAANRSG